VRYVNQISKLHHSKNLRELTMSIENTMSIKRNPKPRRGWVKFTLAGITLALVAGSLVAWRASSAKKEEKKPDADKIFEFAKNDIASVSAQNLGLVIPISGSVRPVVQAMVKSKVAGEISKVYVREGERVVAGQVLASIDTSDLKARNDAQRAMVAESKAKLDLATKNEANNRALLSKNFISQNAFDGVANSMQIAEANHQSSLAQAAITQRALADAQIKAPFAGIVAKRAVNIGEKITADAPVMHIVDLSQMELEAPVPVGDIPSIKVGQEIAFKVDGFQDRAFKGKVERINPSAEAGSRSISIFVTLPNEDGALKGGMFANGTLAAVSRTAVTSIPISALIEEGGQTYVFALKDGAVERKPITIGAKSPERGLAEIRDGIAIGTEVITVKADGLKHGSKAVVKSASAVPAAAPVATKG
jgi:membrane fusion protein, multidrug efflux system